MLHSRPVLRLRAGPFEHVLIEQGLDQETCTKLLNFVDVASWRESRGAFFSFQQINDQKELEMLADLLRGAAVLSEVRAELERTLHVDLRNPHHFGIQRYIKGGGIGPHTDNEIAAARLVLNLNRGWLPADGGIWLLSKNKRLRAPRFIAPLSNSGFAFVPANNTYHALSQRTNSVSYALIIEFPFG